MNTNICRLSHALIQHARISSVRLYRGWMHRKPAKVLLSFEPDSNVSLKEEKVIDLGSHNNVKTRKLGPKQEKVTLSNEESSKEIKENKAIKLKQRKFYISQKKVFDDNGEIIYEKLKENDGRIRYSYSQKQALV